MTSVELKSVFRATNQAAFARKQLPIAKKQAKKPNELQQVKDVEDALVQFDNLQQLLPTLHDKAKIHFRVYHDLDDYQVDLIRTREPEAAAAEEEGK